MAEYSRLARGSFTTAASPVTQVVNLPFQPQRVELFNYTTYSAPAQYGITKAWWDVAMGQGVAAMEYIESASAAWIPAVDYVATGGISTFGLLGSTNAGLMLQYGPQIQIASIAKASPTVVTTASAHGLSVGQVVILEGLYQSSTTGMPQMATLPFVITAVGSTTTFTVTWNSNQSNYTALSASPSGAYVRQVLFPWNYLPGVNMISAINLGGSNVVVTTTNNHNYVVGQEIGFRIPTSWGSVQLNTLPNSTIPGSPTYYYVTSIQSNTQFTCSASTSGVTAFNSNIAVASVPGLTPAQVFAMGDINSGGVQYSGGALYPSPSFPTFTGGSSTVNGPAIQGAFVNNTAQGFSVGLGVGNVQSSAKLLTASSLYIWTAYLFDYSV